MALRFNKTAAGGATNDVATFTMSAAVAALDGGPLTIIAVVKLNAAGAGAYSCPLYTRNATDSPFHAWWVEADVSNWNYGTGTTPRTVGTASTADDWTIMVFRKDAGGTFQPVGRKYVFATATDGGNVVAVSTLIDGVTAGVGGLLQIGRWGNTGTDYSTMDVASEYVFGSYLSDAAVAALLAAPTHAAVLALTPTWAVRCDNTSTITDLSGNGGNSISITSSGVVADPAGFFGGSTVTATANLAAAPTLTAGGVAVVPGAAPLSAAPVLTAAAVAVMSAAAQLAAVPTLTAGGTVDQPAAAALNVAPTLTAAGAVTAPAAAALVAAATLTAAAVRDQPAVAALTSAPTLTAAALAGNDAAAALLATPVLAAAGHAETLAVAALTAAPQLTAAADTAGGASAALTAAPALTVAATGIRMAAVALTARPVLVAAVVSDGGATTPARYVRTRTERTYTRADATRIYVRAGATRTYVHTGTGREAL